MPEKCNTKHHSVSKSVAFWPLPLYNSLPLKGRYGGAKTPSLLGEGMGWGIPTLSVGTTLIVGEVERLTKVDRIEALKRI